ncbi:endonuclease/exonuclease/phosphatase family protein [Simiduia curdlanivorans]|uniref:Endonuclease/exonuclease/phosphatase family protein n=1 Tax=Simiduia curdlanivorans TaxID=1492769 RepID=A0ABV8V2Q5_9GAMM|nr:endonuclease/exonuclease/phosphatase family protein [Simiduia curdlanivorans]MDN3637637.1 endonuclease/exonuclease/phosphatase family protein [Simiduia curdlanivorans]
MSWQPALVLWALVFAPTAFPQTIQPELTLVTLNLAHGRGTNFSQLLISNDRFLPNIETIGAKLVPLNPDIVALQEADAASAWSGNFNHVEKLALDLGLPNIVHGLHVNTWGVKYGTALITRLSLSNQRVHNFASSWPTPAKGFTLATVVWQPSSEHAPKEVNVISLHLDFSRQSVRYSQLNELVSRLGEAKKPIITMGDFNSEEAALHYLHKQLKQNGIELTAFDASSKLLNTYGERRLDWILISDEMTFSHYQVLDERLSDHRAVLAKIRWQKSPALIKGTSE